METTGVTRRTVLKGFGAIVATSALAASARTAAAAESVTWTDLIGRFESRHEPWTLSLGPEYGAATGTFARDSARAATGLASGRITADFSSAGRYVGLVKTLDHLDITRVHLRATGENLTRVTVRLVSGERVLRQGYAALSPTPGTWQTIEMDRWNNIIGFDDAVQLQVQVWKDYLVPGATSATLWVDDVAVDHTVTPVAPVRLEASGLPVLLSSDEDPVPLSVRAVASDDSSRDVTQHSTLTSSDPSVVTVDEFGTLVPHTQGSTEIGVEHLGVALTFPVEVREPQALALVQSVDGRLLDEDRALGFVGFNYDLFLLRYPRVADWTGLEKDIAVMASWGLGVVRVPMNIGMVQAARGVFPDHEDWAGELTSRNLNALWLQMLDFFVDRAGKHGIRTVLDWHRAPVDPYDYWIGGTPADAGTGKAGTAICYLAPSATERGALDVSDAEHLSVLLESHEWISRHFANDGNVLGVEVPHNEPHDAYMSIQSNWRRVTERAARAVKAGDPARLTFAMAPAYGHDVSTAAPTWQVPLSVDGNAPHHYLPNAPIEPRPDAPDRHSPWLARDVDQVFSHAIASLFAPYSTSPVPVYNGEGGHYGFDSFLPDTDRVEAADRMLEAGLVQYYAAGAVGQLHWSLWHNANDFVPFEELFATHYRRFSPVYAAGPVDWRGAPIAVIQNPAAVPASNGHNWAVVPWVRLALDLHLQRFHLLTDDEIIDTMLTQVPSGLEQVDGLSAEFDYRAVIVDRRNLDARVRTVLESDQIDIPLLWVDDMENLSARQLGDFLQTAGVAVDARTSAALQWVAGPEHIVVYRRSAADLNRNRVHPLVEREGTFRLVDEGGTEAFAGSAHELRQGGISVALDVWRSAIYRIEG